MVILSGCYACRFSLSLSYHAVLNTAFDLITTIKRIPEEEINQSSYHITIRYRIWRSHSIQYSTGCLFFKSSHPKIFSLFEILLNWSTSSFYVIRLLRVTLTLSALNPTIIEILCRSKVFVFVIIR